MVSCDVCVSHVIRLMRLDIPILIIILIILSTAVDYILYNCATQLLYPQVTTNNYYESLDRSFNV